MVARFPRWTLIALLAAATAQASPSDEREPRWVGAWASSQMVPREDSSLPDEELDDATLRQIVRLQVPATRMRVRFSNAFGTEPLKIDGATIARAIAPDGAKIDPATLRPLRFGGAAAAIVPAGADYWSDPVELPVAGGADLAVSVHFGETPSRQTGHPGSRATSYVARGDHLRDADLPGAKTFDHWYQLSGIEVASAKGRAVVAFGDSITDGYGVKPNTNLRWTDALQQRLRAVPALRDVAVLNAGIGGNRLLNDGLGPNGLARFDRDVLTPPGVSHVIIFEGVNDLGTLTRDAPVSAEAHAALVMRIIGAYRQMIDRAHAHGIKAIGATITPYGASGYYHPDAANEADRQAINAWIRAPGHFDAVIDFDAAMRDPADPTRLRKDLDSGDGLHPSTAGYRAMGEAVPLALLR
ncbi:SGNH/GDSL hydrolase family protein [Sphingomonas sp. RS6]